MDAMPRPRPPHLHRETNRHGTIVWYVRIGKGPRIRVKAQFGTAEFDEQYKDAIAGTPRNGESARAGSLSWLIERYRESTAWTKLSLDVRKQRERVFKKLNDAHGMEPFVYVDRKNVAAGHDRRKDRPHAARMFVMTLRGLFKWAVAADLASADPTQGIETPRPKTAGFTPWTKEWCEAFEKRWKTGTRERLAYDIFKHTGLRRGDAVRLGRQHVKIVAVGKRKVKKSVATIRTEKTGEVVSIVLPNALLASIKASPTGDLTFIVGERGKPYAKAAFGNWFGKVCKAAGVSGRAHGIRKTRATLAAENGATERELDAMFGWRGGGMSRLYTESANRARLAAEGAAKLEQEMNFYSRTQEQGAGMRAKKRVKSNG